MATDAPTPVPRRASAADRQRVARLLEKRSAQGSISLTTFAARVERASTARSRAELDDLVADVRSPSAMRRATMRTVAWLSALTADVQTAWQGPRLPVLALPADPVRPTTIGRSADCDSMVAEPTVSRRHAELRREGERWLLRDLGSRNGTRVNGMRVLEEIEVRPGDRVRFGDVRYRLVRSRGDADS
jgi:cell pole-organizing protein PopZ